MFDEKILSRRALLRGAGYSLAGLAAAGTMGILLPGCSQTAPATPAAPAAGDLAEKKIEAVQWPLAYVKLDPDVAEKRAYDAYMKDG